ncbi:MAG TPA: Crp/Fnr family transcriptional regulator [Candidatus Saccharimonadales bacterium]|nr:Crp/Fnr family transcriptional regulator [Candidatus Saccharimonadales bacterium]
MPNILDQNNEAFRSYLEKFPLRQIKKGRPILYQGEIPQSIFFVKSGVIKVYNITASGEEKTVGYESADGLMPLEWLFGRSPVSLYYYDTFTDCQVHSVPKTDLLEMLGGNPELAASLLNRAISLYISSTIHLHALEQSKARDKLLYILQYLVMRFGKQLNDDESLIELRLTHQEIANLIGITRETASTEIGRLVKSGILRQEKLHYVVNTNKALRQLGESEFAEVNL